MFSLSSKITRDVKDAIERFNAQECTPGQVLQGLQLVGQFMGEVDVLNPEVFFEQNTGLSIGYSTRQNDFNTIIAGLERMFAKIFAEGALDYQERREALAVFRLYIANVTQSSKRGNANIARRSILRIVRHCLNVEEQKTTLLMPYHFSGANELRLAQKNRHDQPIPKRQRYVFFHDLVMHSFPHKRDYKVADIDAHDPIMVQALKLVFDNREEWQRELRDALFMPGSYGVRLIDVLERKYRGDSSMTPAIHNITRPSHRYCYMLLAEQGEMSLPALRSVHLSELNVQMVLSQAIDACSTKDEYRKLLGYIVFGSEQNRLDASNEEKLNYVMAIARKIWDLVNKASIVNTAGSEDGLSLATLFDALIYFANQGDCNVQQIADTILPVGKFCFGAKFRTKDQENRHKQLFIAFVSKLMVSELSEHCMVEVTKAAKMFDDCVPHLNDLEIYEFSNSVIECFKVVLEHALPYSRAMFFMNAVAPFVVSLNKRFFDIYADKDRIPPQLNVMLNSFVSTLNHNERVYVGHSARDMLIPDLTRLFVQPKTLQEILALMNALQGLKHEYAQKQLCELSELYEELLQAPLVGTDEDDLKVDAQELELKVRGQQDEQEEKDSAEMQESSGEDDELAGVAEMFGNDDDDEEGEKKELTDEEEVVSQTAVADNEGDLNADAVEAEVVLSGHAEAKADIESQGEMRVRMLEVLSQVSAPMMPYVEKRLYKKIIELTDELTPELREKYFGPEFLHAVCQQDVTFSGSNKFMASYLLRRLYAEGGEVEMIKWLKVPNDDGKLLVERFMETFDCSDDEGIQAAFAFTKNVLVLLEKPEISAEDGEVTQLDSSTVLAALSRGLILNIAKNKDAKTASDIGDKLAPILNTLKWHMIRSQNVAIAFQGEEVYQALLTACRMSVPACRALFEFWGAATQLCSRLGEQVPEDFVQTMYIIDEDFDFFDERMELKFPGVNECDFQLASIQIHKGAYMPVVIQDRIYEPSADTGLTIRDALEADNWKKRFRGLLRHYLLQAQTDNSLAAVLLRVILDHLADYEVLKNPKKVAREVGARIAAEKKSQEDAVREHDQQMAKLLQAEQESNAVDTKEAAESDHDSVAEKPVMRKRIQYESSDESGDDDSDDEALFEGEHEEEAKGVEGEQAEQGAGEVTEEQLQRVMVVPGGTTKYLKSLERRDFEESASAHSVAQASDNDVGLPQSRSSEGSNGSDSKAQEGAGNRSPEPETKFKKGIAAKITLSWAHTDGSTLKALLETMVALIALSDDESLIHEMINHREWRRILFAVKKHNQTTLLVHYARMLSRLAKLAKKFPIVTEELLKLQRFFELHMYVGSTAYVKATIRYYGVMLQQKGLDKGVREKFVKALRVYILRALGHELVVKRQLWNVVFEVIPSLKEKEIKKVFDTQDDGRSVYGLMQADIHNNGRGFATDSPQFDNSMFYQMAQVMSKQTMRKYADAFIYREANVVPPILLDLALFPNDNVYRRYCEVLDNKGRPLRECLQDPTYEPIYSNEQLSEVGASADVPIPEDSMYTQGLVRHEPTDPVKKMKVHREEAFVEEAEQEPDQFNYENDADYDHRDPSLQVMVAFEVDGDSQQLRRTLTVVPDYEPEGDEEPMGMTDIGHAEQAAAMSGQEAESAEQQPETKSSRGRWLDIFGRPVPAALLGIRAGGRGIGGHGYGYHFDSYEVPQTEAELDDASSVSLADARVGQQHQQLLQAAAGEQQETDDERLDAERAATRANGGGKDPHAGNGAGLVVEENSDVESEDEDIVLGGGSSPEQDSGSNRYSLSARAAQGLWQPQVVVPPPPPELPGQGVEPVVDQNAAGQISDEQADEQGLTNV